MFDLSEKTAFVTGASRGIGETTARLLAARGARVILAARSIERLQEIAEEIRRGGGEAFPLSLDLSQTEEIAGTVAAAVEATGPVDILINNAGVTADNLLARMSVDQWESVLRTNLTGAFALSKALVRGMMKKRWGRIVNITSVVGMMGNAGQANYAASKAGLIGFTKSLARELGSRNITVNAIAPGYIETAMTAELPEAAREVLTGEIVLGRIGTVDEIAACALFLVSEEASYVTGEVLNVSGGLYI